jgi:proto-oncogene tyrosine-protein kinase ROS
VCELCFSLLCFYCFFVLDNNAVVIAAVVASVVVLVVIILIIIVCIRHHRIVTKENFSVHYHTEDRELEMLRTVRRRTNQDVPFNFNPTYTVEKKLVDGLPSFPRSQLTLNDFLGQGQFGEVYMGVAHGIVAEEESTRVAVKTLRKDANEREREEFLTEARFMSNFQHPNILRLLGVCLDNNPQYMIMELMEGGDLLTFIRASRRDLDHSTLTLSDLVKISFDICAGGKYLEQSRFVHRDLACRNCLVSSKGFDRVVKIGDFGLARNIYENHYYRKEGEGLLPVRWMAPESLVDGLFTTQSDVWSFGVVLWEIFTLGHQPYPTQTNQEVLKFIVQGGRLERPNYCPEDIYGIMLMCWAHQPHDRPTFRALLERLKVLRNRVDRQSFLLEQQNTSSQQGSDSELEEEELTMELDETEREESARAATGEGQVHLGMPDATERYVSHKTMSRQNSSRHGRIRQSVGLTMSESLHGGGSGDTESNKGSPFVGKKRKESGSRRKSSGTSNGASKSSSSLKRLSKRFSKASTMSEEPDRVEIPSSGVVIEFGSSSRLI